MVLLVYPRPFLQYPLLAEGLLMDLHYSVVILAQLPAVDVLVRLLAGHLAGRPDIHRVRKKVPIYFCL